MIASLRDVMSAHLRVTTTAAAAAAAAVAM